MRTFVPFKRRFDSHDDAIKYYEYVLRQKRDKLLPLAVEIIGLEEYLEWLKKQKDKEVEKNDNEKIERG